MIWFGRSSCTERRVESVGSQNIQDAYDLLALTYGWFTEGFDTAVLREAEGLLEELEA